MPVYLAGSKVEGIVGWAPVSGNQPMSFTISTYNGKVIVGIACDKTLVPDHETSVDASPSPSTSYWRPPPASPLNDQLLFGDPPASSFQAGRV